MEELALYVHREAHVLVGRHKGGLFLLEGHEEAAAMKRLHESLKYPGITDDAAKIIDRRYGRLKAKVLDLDAPPQLSGRAVRVQAEKLLRENRFIKQNPDGGLLERRRIFEELESKISDKKKLMEEFSDKTLFSERRKVNVKIHELLKNKDPLTVKIEGVSGLQQQDSNLAAEFLSNIVGRGTKGVVKTPRGELIVKSTPWKAHPALQRQASYYDPATKLINMEPNARAATFVHESGHVIEGHNKAWLDRTLRFLKDRRGNEKATWLGPGYDAREMAWEDRFIEKYMGYDQGGHSSEITSVGFEMLFGNPMRLLVQDPEYFELMVDVARGNLF
jgi:hypothetical protein